MNSLVLTSASLSVAKDMSFFENNCGLKADETIILDSPFDYEQQVEMFVADSPLLHPSHQSYQKALSQYCLEAVKETGGGAFILFTNKALMQKTYETIAEKIEDEGLEVLIQGKESKRDIIYKFKENENLVLFALDSFWTGVDVQGHHLRHVVITKLPFPAYASPHNRRKTERIEQHGGNGFRDFMLPSSVLKFKQGFGRLIRSTEDRGRVTVLDPRLMGQSYGRVFFQSLPPISNS